MLCSGAFAAKQKHPDLCALSVIILRERTRPSGVLFGLFCHYATAWQMSVIAAERGRVKSTMMYAPV